MTGLAAGEPAPEGLSLLHRHGTALTVRHREQDLLRYVYQPWDDQRESPRPYFHPVHTLDGARVSLYRPHDHVWHKGIAWSLPNVGTANFWGGPTYHRGFGYRQLPNDGAMRHRDFLDVHADPAAVRVRHRLDWVTEPGDTWFEEVRSFAVTVDSTVSGWTLAFDTRFRNVGAEPIVIGSPTTEGRENAGYGGLFWRGPRSFTGGTVYAPGVTGRDELMGIRAPWLGFAGQHDEHGGASTLAFVDDPGNPDHPTRWFVRSEPFACVCPAPFFDTEVPVAPGETLRFRYAVTVADGDRGLSGCGPLAESGRAALRGLATWLRRRENG
nr:PmoA family protein [Micromonospora sp. DSM 115978]